MPDIQIGSKWIEHSRYGFGRTHTVQKVYKNGNFTTDLGGKQQYRVWFENEAYPTGNQFKYGSIGLRPLTDEVLLEVERYRRVKTARSHLQKVEERISETLRRGTDDDILQLSAEFAGKHRPDA